jgi:hypothetical protein
MPLRRPGRLRTANSRFSPFVFTQEKQRQAAVTRNWWRKTTASAPARRVRFAGRAAGVRLRLDEAST